MRATTNPVFRRSQGYTPVLFFALFWTLKPGSALRGMYYPTTWCLPVFFRQPLGLAEHHNNIISLERETTCTGPVAGLTVAGPCWT